MDNKLKLPGDRDLVFIDIEATDDRCSQEMIQFSAIRKNLNGDEKEFDQLFIPKKQLSTYIINLLKIDNVFLKKNGKQFDDCKNEIIDFIKDSIIVSFGDWDFKFLSNQLNIDLEKDLKCEKYDLQKELRVISGKKQLPLLQMYNYIFEQNNCHKKYQHCAMFDTKMLKDIFFKIKEMSDDDMSNLIPYVHLMPRTSTPCHKIFSKSEHENKWTNSFIKTNKPFIIKKMEIGKFKNKKHEPPIHYLKELIGGFNSPFDNTIIRNSFSDIESVSIYDIYKDQIECEIKNFLNSIDNSQLIFYSTSKEKVQHFCEFIYDITKKYCELNYINLDILKKQKHEENEYKIFCDLVSKLQKDKQIKFNGYYYEKNNH